MRIFMVWLVAISIMFVTTLSWYISQPIVFGVATALGTSIGSSGTGRNITNAALTASVVWGPLADLLTLAWAIVSSQKYDPTSEVQG